MSQYCILLCEHITTLFIVMLMNFYFTICFLQTPPLYFVSIQHLFSNRSFVQHSFGCKQVALSSTNMWNSFQFRLKKSFDSVIFQNFLQSPTSHYILIRLPCFDLCRTIYLRHSTFDYLLQLCVVQSIFMYQIHLFRLMGIFTKYMISVARDVAISVCMNKKWSILIRQRKCKPKFI